jgi:hypothetical protein
MKTALTGEAPAEHLALEWMSPEGADELSNARAALDAFFSVAEGSLEILALEVRVGCYDRETHSHTSIDREPPRPHHLLILEPRPTAVRISPIYRVLETSRSIIDRESVSAFADHILAQSCGETSRYETSLCELIVLASRTSLPQLWAATSALVLECYAGTVEIPIEYRNGAGWISTPPVEYLVPQPVGVSLLNADDLLRLTIDVYWSPWIGELARSGSPLADAVARLEARGWRRSSD